MRQKGRRTWSVCQEETECRRTQNNNNDNINYYTVRCLTIDASQLAVYFTRSGPTKHNITERWDTAAVIDRNKETTILSRLNISIAISRHFIINSVSHRTELKLWRLTKRHRKFYY